MEPVQNQRGKNDIWYGNGVFLAYKPTAKTTSGTAGIDCKSDVWYGDKRPMVRFEPRETAG